MILLRPLAAATLCISCLYSEWATAQIVECPGSLSEMAGAPLRNDAKTLDLLQRFVGALDLQHLSSVSATGIMSRHAHHPDELMARLWKLDDECVALAQEGWQLAAEQRQQIMRRRFLQTVLTSSGEPSTDIERTIRDVEGKIQRSIVEQSRRRWFRDPKSPKADANRWAVIVASPTAATAWDALKRHQERWPEMHFELHVPYDKSNPHYAIVAGRRLSEDEAATLVDQVLRTGLASDSYKFPLPMSAITKRMPVGDVNDRSDAKIAAVERQEADPPASDDHNSEAYVMTPAQFVGEARAASSFLDRFTAWWGKLIASSEVISPSYVRPNCGLSASDQVAGLPFCARDNDEDRGSGTRSTPGRGAGPGTGGGTGGGGGPRPKDPDDPC